MILVLIHKLFRKPNFTKKVTFLTNLTVSWPSRNAESHCKIATPQNGVNVCLVN